MRSTANHQASAGTTGFTLIELLVTVVVLAILLTLAVPSLQESFRRNEIAAQNNELIALIHLARNEAIRRNPQPGDTVRLQLITGSAQWSGRVLPPASAAIDDDEVDPECPPDVDAIRCAEHTKANLSSDNVLLRFDNRGYLVDIDGNPDEATLTLTHEKCANENHARLISVMRGGQVASEPTGCGA